MSVNPNPDLMNSGALVGQDGEPPLADDLLRTVQKIAQFLGEDERRVFKLCEAGRIPCSKEGRSWISSKTALRAHYARRIAARGPEAHQTKPAVVLDGA